jgi:hypothetical protein
LENKHNTEAECVETKGFGMTAGRALQEVEVGLFPGVLSISETAQAAVRPENDVQVDGESGKRFIVPSAIVRTDQFDADTRVIFAATVFVNSESVGRVYSAAFGTVYP